MANTVVVTITNICLYVLRDDAAEGWLMDDHRHEPKLVLDPGTMEVPKQHTGRPHMDISGCVVAFGSEGKLFGAGPSRLAGEHSLRLANLRQIAPGASLAPGWAVAPRNGDWPFPPPGMVTRVILDGGLITPMRDPDPRRAAAEDREWTIGKVRQQLVSRCEFSHEAGSAAFARVFNPTFGTHIDIPLKLRDGRYSVTLGAHEKGKDPALRFSQGVTFITEFEAFDKPVRVKGSTQLPTPFTYWPEYLQQTDPAGGPCPDGLYDDRDDGSPRPGNQ